MHKTIKRYKYKHFKLHGSLTHRFTQVLAMNKMFNRCINYEQDEANFKQKKNIIIQQQEI